MEQIFLTEWILHCTKISNSVDTAGGGGYSMVDTAGSKDFNMGVIARRKAVQEDGYTLFETISNMMVISFTELSFFTLRMLQEMKLIV